MKWRAINWCTLWGGLLLAAVAAIGGASAQSPYPNRPIKMLIPFAPGGASDFVARVIQTKLAEGLGQQIVIENRPGAAGVLATEITAHATPDGYTIFLGNIGTLAINKSVFAKEMKVDPVKDLEAITLLADTPSMLIVRKDLPVKNVQELVAYAKARPGQLNFASPGSGSLNRLEMELFRKKAGLDMVHIPFKGGAGPAVADVIAGHVDLMFTTTSSAIEHVRSNLLKALAVSAPKRIPGLPDLPTMIESGFPDSVSSSWQGVVAPAGTPKPIIDKLYSVLTTAMQQDDVRQRLQTGGMDSLISKSPAEFAAYIASESQKWSSVVKESGATAD
jgi:tripartite-type tricarboxylate transporter receptor subunit TctC